ncbi:unnamed protein product [Sphagnum balticum]
MQHLDRVSQIVIIISEACLYCFSKSQSCWPDKSFKKVLTEYDSTEPWNRDSSVTVQQHLSKESKKGVSRRLEDQLEVHYWVVKQPGN